MGSWSSPSIPYHITPLEDFITIRADGHYKSLPYIIRMTKQLLENPSLGHRGGTPVPFTNPSLGRIGGTPIPFSIKR
jgi:hypothetical protein